MEFGDRIKLLREKHELTQEQLANKVGISRAALAKYEKNNREPDFKTMKQIAEFFDVSIDYLLGREQKSEIVIDIKEMLEDTKRKATWGGEELDEEQRELLKTIFGPIRDQLKNQKKVVDLKRSDDRRLTI